MKFNLLMTITGLALLFGASTTSFASSVVLQWDPNTDTDLAGYKIYYKADSSELPFDGADAADGAAPLDVQNQTTATVAGLAPGHTYYFAVTAYNTAGQESSYSNIVAEELPLPDTTSPVVSTFATPQAGYSIGDALQALRIAAGTIKPTSDQYTLLDVAPLYNGRKSPNGKIDILDALLILSRAVGLTTW